MMWTFHTTSITTGQKLSIALGYEYTSLSTIRYSRVWAADPLPSFRAWRACACGLLIPLPPITQCCFARKYLSTGSGWITAGQHLNTVQIYFIVQLIPCLVLAIADNVVQWSTNLHKQDSTLNDHEIPYSCTCCLSPEYKEDKTRFLTWTPNAT